MKTKLFLLAVFVFCAVKANANIQYSGTCGEHVTWRINTLVHDENGYEYLPHGMNGDTLYIEGYGEMTNYQNYNNSPWSNSKTSPYDIKYISIQEGVTSIGKYAFSYMAQDGNGLYITIPNTITTIGYGAFWYSHISVINIPNSVTTIGKYAFHGCRLYSIDIPGSVTDIGMGAFRYCTGLYQFNVAEDNPNYSSPNGLLCNKAQTILIQCPPLLQESEFAIPNTITTIGNYAFGGCYYSNIIIPNSVTTIEYYAFANCQCLQSITIPSNVSSFGTCVFDGCSQLRSINVVADNLNFSSIGGVLFNKMEDTLIIYPPGRIGAYSIPNGVTTIAESAFVSSTKLTVINIPNSVTTIEKSAFSNCASLVSVTIPDGVTEIASSTFTQCTNLSLIDFGKKITRIGSCSFWCCSSLQSVVIPEGVKVIESAAFDGCHNLSSISIPSTVDSIYRIAFHLNNLETVYNYSKVPQTISRDVFWGSYDEVKGTLYVPEESIALYQAADVWKEFNSILPLPSTEAIDNINTGETQHNITKKIAKDGQVLILRNGKTYTMQGQEVK